MDLAVERYSNFLLGTPEEPGVIPRAINDVFTYIEEVKFKERLYMRIPAELIW